MWGGRYVTDLRKGEGLEVGRKSSGEVQKRASEKW